MRSLISRRGRGRVGSSRRGLGLMTLMSWRWAHGAQARRMSLSTNGLLGRPWRSTEQKELGAQACSGGTQKQAIGPGAALGRPWSAQQESAGCVRVVATFRRS